MCNVQGSSKKACQIFDIWLKIPWLPRKVNSEYVQIFFARVSNMCDFQFLPMDKLRAADSSSCDNSETKETGDKESDKDKETIRLVPIYDEVYCKKLVPRSWLDRPKAPLFIPPAVFSRMDLPQDYQVFGLMVCAKVVGRAV